MEISISDQNKVDEFVEACRDGNEDVVKSHLNQLNGKNSGGDTGLQMASSFGRTEIVTILCEQGSALEVDATNNSLETALMLAAGDGHFEVVFKLLRAGADLDKRDRLGWNALHHACSNGHANIIKLLLQRGIDTFVKDNSGCSPLWLACASGDAECVRLLLLAGCDPDECSEEGLSARDAIDESDVSEEEREVIEHMLMVASQEWRIYRRPGDDELAEEEEDVSQPPPAPLNESQLENANVSAATLGDEEEEKRTFFKVPTTLEEPLLPVESRVLEPKALRTDLADRVGPVEFDRDEDDDDESDEFRRRRDRETRVKVVSSLKFNPAFVDVIKQPQQRDEDAERVVERDDVGEI